MGQAQYRDLRCQKDDFSMRLRNTKTRTRTEKLKLHTQLKKYMSMDIS